MHPMNQRAQSPFILIVALAAAFPAGISALAAGNDNDVEWNGVFSHPGMRSPLHPGRNQSFTVELRVFRGDITRARVRTWDGAARFHDMAWNRSEGSYDIWRGTVAGTAADYIYYYFEITDGADVDYFNALGMWSDPPPRGDFLINTTPLGKHPLGATVVPGGAVFRVWAPNASAVTVAGTFNGWSASSHPLASVQGFWQGMVNGAAAGSEYKFVIQNGGALWRTDPRARRQVNSVGNSIIADPGSYRWGDAGWATPYFEEMIIYELHVGTFSGEGDGVAGYPGRCRDAADRHLDHLVELGINAVELMPVGEFAGDRSWGYNPSFLFAPESAYGSPDDLKYFIDRCHQRGIAVILDVVYNHLGGSDLAGNLLDYDGREIYFYPAGNSFRDSPWGPRPDYGRVEVRDLIRDNIRYWLEEFHLDGFRLDGTDFVKVNGDGWRLLQDIAQEVDAVSEKAVVIAEQLPNDPAVTRSIDQGGAGSDAQWNDAFHDSLRAAIGTAAFGDPDAGAVAAGMNHFSMPGTQAVNYIESHDEAAVLGRVARAADPSDPQSEWAYGRSKLAMGLVMFTAGMPMILQGQEFLEDRKFGDARENRIQWSYRTRHADFFQAVKDMITLRRLAPSLRSDGRQNIYHLNESANVIAWHRWTAAGDDLVLVASFDNSDFDSYCLGFPLGGEWFEVLNSDAAAYGGRNRGNGGSILAAGGPMDGLNHSACIVLPRMGVLAFARRPIPLGAAPGFKRGDANGDRAIDISDPVHVLLGIFAGGDRGPCWAAGDANSDDAVAIGDAVYLLSLLFRGGPAPGAPWPGCGPYSGGLECSTTCGG